MTFCELTWEHSTLSDPLGAPIGAPPENWFFEPPPDFDFTFAWVDVCGDVGRFASSLGEIGSTFGRPFVNPDGQIIDRVPAIEHSTYFNERAENPQQVMRADGTVASIPAGRIGFGHSPSTIRHMSELYPWQDRRNPANHVERALASARYHIIDGHLCLLGALDHSVTRDEALRIRGSEISMEFGPINTPYGFRDEVHGASLLIRGNASTSAGGVEVGTERMFASLGNPLYRAHAPEGDTMAAASTSQPGEVIGSGGCQRGSDCCGSCKNAGKTEDPYPAAGDAQEAMGAVSREEFDALTEQLKVLSDIVGRNERSAFNALVARS